MRILDQWWNRQNFLLLTLLLRLTRTYRETCCENTSRNSQNFLNNRNWPNAAPTLFFSENIGKGQFFITLGEEGPYQMKTSCREYTLPRSEETSRVVETRRSAQSWMWRYAFIKDVTVLGSWSNLFFETEQFLGLRIVNGIDKYVTETSQEIPFGSVENGRTGKPVAKAKPRPKPTFTLTPPVSILHHERKWIDIDPGQFRQGFFEVSKFMINSSRRRWSSKIWRPGRKNQGKVCWYFAMDNWRLDCFPGKRRRTEEKGFSTAWTLILLNISFISNQSNPGTFRRHSRWSYIAR